MASLPAPLNLIYSRTQCTSVTSCIGGKFPYKQQSNAIVSHISTRTSRNNRTSNDSLTTNCVSSNSPIVSADDNWGVWTALFATGAFGLWSEKTKIGSMISAALVSILAGLAASNLGIIPHDAPAYSVVFQYLLPLTIPLLLFRADLRQVIRTTGTLFLAFLLGSVATVVGTSVAFLIVPMRSLGQDNWKIASALMGSYIGGAINYIAICEALAVSPSVIAAGVAADNVICALYFVLLFALASKIPAEAAKVIDDSPYLATDESIVSVPQMATALAVSFAICKAANSFSKTYGIKGGELPAVTAIVVILATLLPNYFHYLAPAGDAFAFVLMQSGRDSCCIAAGYMLVWVMLPTSTYKLSWAPKLNKRLNSTYFREQGTNLVLFSFPLMLVAAMGCVYLHFPQKKDYASNKSFYNFFRRPALVMAPLGIVNSVEIMFSAMFIVLLIWSLANYMYVSIKYPFMHRHGVEQWQVIFRGVSLRLGYIGNTCWAFLFFPVTRGSSILPLVGLTSESSIKYHIWLGHISNILFALHSIGFVIYWWAMSHEMYLMLEWSSTYLSNVAGVIAFVMLLVMWALSFDRVRRKMFEVFFYSHHLYIPIIFFYMLHVGVAYLCMILPGIFLFLIDRYLRFLQSKRRARLDSTRLLPNGTMELTFCKDQGLSYNPTSILFLHVPSICKLQWHPFTVISNSNLETNKLSVMIKSQGSWTQKLYKLLSSHPDHLQVSTEGPYGPSSSHFLSRESLVMISGGSGIAPFISIIREIIFRSTESNVKVPKLLLVAAFKNTTDLAMLDLLLPLSCSPLDISKLQLQIKAYVTQEQEMPVEGSKKEIETKLFKPNPTDSPISAVLGKNSWLWLGAIISSSFVMFLLLLGFVTRFHIYPVEMRGENYHYSYKLLWDMFLVCVSIFLSTSAIFLWEKRNISGEGKKQIEDVDLPTPTRSPSSWLNVSDREVESLPQQSLVQSTNVHYGARPDLKRILLDCEGSDVGVLVCGTKNMRYEVARICASASAKNLYFESISFNW